MKCLCGCGEKVKKGNKYISGHNLKYLKKTDEHKRNIGKANKGKNRTTEQRKKISENHADMSGENNPMFGKTQSESSKTKISKSKIGTTPNFTEKDIERRRKLMIENNPMKNPEISKLFEGENNPMKRPEVRCKFQGENNWNWRGGISCEPYCEQWLDKDYKQSIKRRDGNKCLNPYCNKKSKNLRLHHIDYNKKNCHPLNLITICVSCNTRANSDRDWHKSWYKAIIHNRYMKGKLNE